MFDLGFSELLLIAAVALVVLGPERLPKVARMAGLWVGRIQNFISNVKTDLSNQAGMAEFKAARDSIEQTAQQLRQDVHQQVLMYVPK
ncbi:Sec-independent protein translocase protein TatB [Snodgrassella sp. CFCC 13594]|uniref:Sec-independent protein translocase protein TatB n=1 Tax=Snodgrassella sp. CFCC 13594 TaxID=1775559 RepID=UPI0008305ABE|nr:Sec-independent protein translocase protein TatB [Snodgrassella sp. CFCC 13594]